MADADMRKEKLQEITERMGNEVMELFENRDLSVDEIRDVALGMITQLEDRLQTLPTERQVETVREAIVEESDQGDSNMGGSNDSYSIYQLKDEPETRYFRFMPKDYLEMKGIDVDKENYNLVYSALLEQGMTLDGIYAKFNTVRPSDFTGHSLSVSDMVVLHQNGEDTSYYVDAMGFVEIPGFELVREAVAETKNSYYVIEDLSTWANNSEGRSALERFDDISDAMSKFNEYRGKERDYSDGNAKTTLGIGIGMTEFDVLHVRGNENYLVQDFMLIKAAEGNQEFLADLQAIHDTIGFDKIRLTREMTPEEIKGFVRERFEYQMSNSGLEDISVYIERFDSLYEQNRMDNLMPTANQQRITEVLPVIEWDNPYLVQREPEAHTSENAIVVTLTVAECGEFHNHGEYHEGVERVEEAIAILNQIPPERLNGIPSIGINIHTVGTEDYADIQLDILSGKVIDLEILNYVPEIKNNGKAMELVAELVEKMPEKEVIGTFPEHRAFQEKVAVILAAAFDQFSYDFDSYQYRDMVEDRVAQVENMAKDITSGNSSYLNDFLQGVIDDDGLEEDVRRATELLKRLEEYKPLAKVEELKESNYNMIDNVLNNEKPKKEEERSEGRISVKEKLAEKKATLTKDVKQHSQRSEYSQDKSEKRTEGNIII